MAVRLIVADDDLTGRASGLQWTNTDPGGHETCEFLLPNDCACPQPGDPVTIWDGYTRLWTGRVEEPGDNYDERRAPGQVGAIGAGAALKDTDIAEIFIDRDLSHWEAAPVVRKVAANSTFRVFDPTVGNDGTNAAVRTNLNGPWTTAPGRPLAEAWYIPNGLRIGHVLHQWVRGTNVNNADTNWSWSVQLASSVSLASVDSSGNLRAAGPGSGTVTATTTDRIYALVGLNYGNVAAGDQREYAIDWTLAVIGTHGLTLRGASPSEGLYPEDIAGWVLDQATGISRGILEPSGFILPHAAYLDPVPHEQIIDDMATLLGWHWGVWAPDSLLDSTPVLHFRPPPEDATATVDRADCRNLRLAQRLSDFHNQARVHYTDTAGNQATVLVTRENPRLPAGLDRTLTLNIGPSDAAAAAIIGEANLALAEQQTRAAGSTELPPSVSTPSGGRTPAHHLRPGLDRIKINGLPRAGAWTEADTRRFDTFRISRTTSRVAAGGAVTTTAELDSGSNLQETLNARLSLAALLAS